MQAEFVASAYSEKDFPREELPEVVLAGRSNVGKSSLINRLAGRKDLAKTSGTPGKTRSVNFYRLDRSIGLVDLPGYGYARAGRAESRAWKQLIERYFAGRAMVALVVHLVDARRTPMRADQELSRWLDHLQARRLVVATKADKLSGNERAVQRKVLSETFQDCPLIMASAVTGMGCKEIWNEIIHAVRKG
jgi:GTP-binding protein